jgi:acyl-CoA reductase-like NAD-dependent aldehyde dehydrogenase
MAVEARANRIGAEWREASRGARFAAGAAGEGWPQSGPEDVALAREAAERACARWAAAEPRRRAERVLAMARALERDGLERDGLLGAELRARFQLTPDELAGHVAGLEGAVRAELEAGGARAPAVTWCAPDARELLRAPLLELARELAGGSVLVLVSDARVPELLQAFARAALEAELPAGVLGLLHGARRELLALGLEAHARSQGSRLLASGLASEMAELRRLEQRSGAEARLRGLRCGALELHPAHPLEDSVAEVLEHAFGRGATLGGQAPGALGRVWCPARLFSRFTELFLEALEPSPAALAPVPQLDDDAVERVRLAVELGLDEGATCIAGGMPAEPGRMLAPTVFTNVEGYMSSARRQDPLPVLCLLRSS